MLKTLASTTNVVVANNVANIECLDITKAKCRMSSKFTKIKLDLDNTLMSPT